MKGNVKTSLRPVRLKAQSLTQSAVQELRDAIEQGVYAPGSQLPPELELVQMLGVSRTVVREALRNLQEDGLIARRQGLGTFVRKNPILQNLNVNFGTTEMIRSAGMTSSTPHLLIQEAAANPQVADALGLNVDTPVIVIERVRAADGKPVVYSLDYIAKSLVGDADLSVNWQERDISLYQVVQGNLGLVIEYGITRILPVKAPPRAAKMLRVSPDSPLLYMLQTDFAPHDVPVLYSCEYHLPDAFDFYIIRRGPRKTESTSGGSPAPRT
jgi:GntR family transcriptional regulator